MRDVVTFASGLLLALVAACGSDSGQDADKGAPASPADAGSSHSALSGRAIGCNVLLVTLDTTRADHLGCYGSTVARTPTLDRIAKEGVLVERALTVAPITLPSHASILSGVYPIDHGARDNGIFRVPDETQMLAETLKESGYSTAAFVSTYILSEVYGTGQGFDTYDAHMVGSSGREVAHVERRAASTVNAALKWLEDAPPEPWFLWLHFYDPHQPFDPPAPFDTGFAHPYDGEIAYTDHQLERFLQSYTEERLDRTVLVVTSDHGYGLGEHQESTHGQFIYDSTMCVPLLLRHPSLGAGRRLGGQAVVTDIVPTILDLLSIPGDPAMLGQTLLPALAGSTSGPAQVWHDAYLETQLTYYFFGIAPLDAVCDERFKFIEAPRPELYAWPEDPGESENLYESSPEVVRTMREKLARFRAGRDVLAAGPNREMSAAEEAKLALLGYIREDGHTGERTSGASLVDPKDYVSIKAKVDEARRLMLAASFARAEALLDEVLAVCPLDTLALTAKSEVQIHRGNVEEGLETLRQLLERRPDMTAAAQNLARVCRRTGRYQQALGAYDTIIAASPSQVKCYFQASQICSKLKRYEDARGYLVRLQDAVELTEGQRKQVAERLAEIDRSD